MIIYLLFFFLYLSWRIILIHNIKLMIRIRVKGTIIVRTCSNRIYNIWRQVRIRGINNLLLLILECWRHGSHCRIHHVWTMRVHVILVGGHWWVLSNSCVRHHKSTHYIRILIWTHWSSHSQTRRLMINHLWVYRKISHCTHLGNEGTLNFHIIVHHGGHNSLHVWRRMSHSHRRVHRSIQTSSRWHHLSSWRRSHYWSSILPRNILGSLVDVVSWSHSCLIHCFCSDCFYRRIVFRIILPLLIQSLFILLCLCKQIIIVH